jgi:hypothetical protein
MRANSCAMSFCPLPLSGRYFPYENDMTAYRVGVCVQGSRGLCCLRRHAHEPSQVEAEAPFHECTRGLIKRLARGAKDFVTTVGGECTARSGVSIRDERARVIQRSSHASSISGTRNRVRRFA